MICVGTISSYSSAVGVCKKKVITSPIGQMTFSALITLMAIYYTYDLEYNSSVKQVLHFLQEKVIQHPLSKTKATTAYTNLYRAVSCIEQRNELAKETQQDQVESGQTEMSQETQPFCDFCRQFSLLLYTILLVLSYNIVLVSCIVLIVLYSTR